MTDRDPDKPSPSGGDQDHEDNSAVAHGAGMAFLGRLGALVEAVSQPVFTWAYGAATYGLFATLWALVKISTAITECAMTTTLQRTIPGLTDEDQVHRALKVALITSLSLSALVTTGIVASAPWLAGVLNAESTDSQNLVDIIRLYALVLPFWTLVEVLTSAVRARRRFGPEIRVRIFYEQILRLLAAVGFAGLGWQSFGLFLAHLVSVALAAGLAIRLVAQHFDLGLMVRVPMDRRFKREMLGFGIAMAPATLIKRLNSELPVMLLNILIPGAAGATAAGIYAVARKIASVLQVIRISFEYVLAPLTTAKDRADHKALATMYGFALRLSLGVALPLGLALLLALQDILLVFSQEFAAAAAPLAILVIGRMAEAWGGPATAIVEMRAPRLTPLLNGAAGLVLTLVLFAPLVTAFGIAGAALAAALGYNLTSFLGITESRLWFKLTPFPAGLGKTLLVAIACAGGLGILLPVVPADLAGARIGIALIGLVISLFLVGRLGLPEGDVRALGRLGRWLRPVRD